MSLYQYGNDFYAYQQIGSLTSARAVVPLVLHHLKPTSILDVGCGAGAWLAAYLECGATDIAGVDGHYVRPEQLLFNPACFRATDVSRSFCLGRRFDLVQCLEVAEHLDPASSEALVDNLVAHAPIVVFSAAPPGQGGEHHINERPYGYWRNLFAERGYDLFDFLRPKIRYCDDVEHWYRYNMLVFVKRDVTSALEPDVATTRVDQRQAVPDVAPLGWRMRRKVLALLPPAIITGMASLKHALVLRKLSVRIQPK